MHNDMFTIIMLWIVYSSRFVSVFAEDIKITTMHKSTSTDQVGPESCVCMWIGGWVGGLEVWELAVRWKTHSQKTPESVAK